MVRPQARTRSWPQFTVNSAAMTSRPLLAKWVCLGLCYAEPLVDIAMPNGSRIFYNNMTPGKVLAIVYSHLVRREPVVNLAMGVPGR